MTASQGVNDEEFEIGIASTKEDLVSLRKLTLTVPWQETPEEFELEAEIWLPWFSREKKSGEMISRITTADQGIFLGLGSACTHPEYQRRGLASKLLCEIIRKEMKEGKKRPIVCMSTEAGLKLYKSLDFNQIGKAIKFYLSPDQSIIKIDVKATAKTLSVSFRLIEETLSKEDLSKISILAKEATSASFENYYKTFLSLKKGQEHHRPVTYIIENVDSKIIAFGSLFQFMELRFVGPIMSPNAEIAQLLLQMLIEYRDAHFADKPVVFDVIESNLSKDSSDWISRLKSIGLTPSGESPLFQYNHESMDSSSSIFESYSQKNVFEYVMHNPVIM